MIHCVRPPGATAVNKILCVPPTNPFPCNDSSHKFIMKSLNKLVILYCRGGLGDVGRHAVRVALDRPDVDEITVLSPHAESLEDENWKCGCPEPHKFTAEERKRFKVIKIESWEDESLLDHFENAKAVITALGNRQWFLGDDVRVGGRGSHMVIKGMKKHKIERAVVISSVGIQEDWPPLEWIWPGKIMACIFSTCSRREFRDLTEQEQNYKDSPEIDYLFVRPVGIGEDVLPQNTWLIQKEKYKDTSLYFNMAKLDCARFMVKEALEPSRHRTGAVIGAPMPEKNKKSKE
jgi:hypothetical protein